jgi:hypothetical protein
MVKHELSVLLSSYPLYAPQAVFWLRGALRSGARRILHNWSAFSKFVGRFADWQNMSGFRKANMCSIKKIKKFSNTP